MFINYFCAKFIKMSHIQNLEKNLSITTKITYKSQSIFKT